jgi:hypothetical protein
MTERMQRTVEPAFEDVDGVPLRASRRVTGSARATGSSRKRVFSLGVPVVIALNKVDRLKAGHSRDADGHRVEARRLPRAASR